MLSHSFAIILSLPLLQDCKCKLSSASILTVTEYPLNDNSLKVDLLGIMLVPKVIFDLLTK